MSSRNHEPVPRIQASETSDVQVGWISRIGNFIKDHPKATIGTVGGTALLALGLTFNSIENGHSNDKPKVVATALPHATHTESTPTAGPTPTESPTPTNTPEALPADLQNAADASIEPGSSNDYASLPEPEQTAYLAYLTSGGSSSGDSISDIATFQSDLYTRSGNAADIPVVASLDNTPTQVVASSVGLLRYAFSRTGDDREKALLSILVGGRSNSDYKNTNPADKYGFEQSSLDNPEPFDAISQAIEEEISIPVAETSSGIKTDALGRTYQDIVENDSKFGTRTVRYYHVTTELSNGTVMSFWLDGGVVSN